VALVCTWRGGLTADLERFLSEWWGWRSPSPPPPPPVLFRQTIVNLDQPTTPQSCCVWCVHTDSGSASCIRSFYIYIFLPGNKKNQRLLQQSGHGRTYDTFKSSVRCQNDRICEQHNPYAQKGSAWARVWRTCLSVGGKDNEISARVSITKRLDRSGRRRENLNNPVDDNPVDDNHAEFHQIRLNVTLAPVAPRSPPIRRPLYHK